MPCAPCTIFARKKQRRGAAYPRKVGIDKFVYARPAPKVCCVALVVNTLYLEFVKKEMFRSNFSVDSVTCRHNELNLVC
jgi:hypothetical protein